MSTFYFEKQNNDLQSYPWKNAERLLTKQNFEIVMRTKIWLTVVVVVVVFCFGRCQNLTYDLRCTIWAQIDKMAGYAPDLLGSLILMRIRVIPKEHMLLRNNKIWRFNTNSKWIPKWPAVTHPCSFLYTGGRTFRKRWHPEVTRDRRHI